MRHHEHVPLALVLLKRTVPDDAALVVPEEAIVPQGGNTGLVLGSIPTEDRPAVVLSLDRMTRVRSLDADNFALVAEAGSVYAGLHASWVAQQGR